ncbi:MAG: ferredoxin [Chloroflexota bacterium]|nr:ferredoxin [Chloroflexota bacterium]
MYQDIFMDITATLSKLGEEPWGGVWGDKHWMNTPGALYGGQTDNCGTGPLDAPNNIQVDHKGYEFIFRQPVNLYELRQVLQAAYDDPFQGYGADGDAHWSYDGVKEWWTRKRELEAEIDQRYKEQLALEDHKDYRYFVALQRWRDYLETGMHAYLRAYAFFLSERRVPRDEDRLPDL